VLLILDRAERRPRLLWLAPIACALWANLHAGGFLGPVVLAAAALGSVLDRRRGPAATPGPHPAAIGLVALASAGALLITPVGAGLFRYLAFHIDIHALHPVDEFRAPSWLSDAPLLLFAGATGLSLLLVRRPPAPWREILPAVALAALAARSVRFGAELVLIATPLMATRLTTLVRARTLSGDSRLAPPSRCCSPPPWRWRRWPRASPPRPRVDRSSMSRSTGKPCRWRRWTSSPATASTSGCTTTSSWAATWPGPGTRAAGCSPIPVCPPTPGVSRDHGAR
jgi:hypothetical protein